jgi:hypothetical protein
VQLHGPVAAEKGWPLRKKLFANTEVADSDREIVALIAEILPSAWKLLKLLYNNNYKNYS